MTLDQIHNLLDLGVIFKRLCAFSFEKREFLCYLIQLLLICPAVMLKGLTTVQNTTLKWVRVNPLRSKFFHVISEESRMI